MSVFSFLNEDIIKNALLEDLHHGTDVTSHAVIPPKSHLKAKIQAREACIIAGAPLIEMVFKALNNSIDVKTLLSDGDKISPGETIAEISGQACHILSAERTALNFLSHLSGIATKTHQYVQETRGTHAQICATRKTIPGLRRLQKYAVMVGGGKTHRFGLDDAILIKDNHIAFHKGDIGACLQMAKDKRSHMAKIEIEVDTLAQLEKVLPYKPDIVLLDNMDMQTLKTAIEIVNGLCKTEASGGITLENIAQIAQTGVDYISVGALTHSVKAIDFGLDT